MDKLQLCLRIVRAIYGLQLMMELASGMEIILKIFKHINGLLTSVILDIKEGRDGKITKLTDLNLFKNSFTRDI